MAYWPAIRTGAWFSLRWGPMSSITGRDQNLILATIATGEGMLHPFWTGPEDISVDGAGLWSVGTHPAVKLILRPVIYAATSDEDPYPGALVKDAGDITVSAAGLNSVTWDPVTLTAKKLYWVGFKCEQIAGATTATIGCQDAVNPYNPYVTSSADGASNENRRYRGIGKTGLGTGAWADPAATGFDFISTWTLIPVVYWRGG